MKPEKVKDFADNFKKEIQDSIKALGFKEAEKKLNISKKSLYCFCNGTLKYSTDKILQMAEKLNLEI